MDAPDRRSGVAGFERAAADYETARPGYPDAAVRRMAAEVGIGPGRRVCDLAAGTGKLTRALLALGADVVAVEPAAAMRAELRRALPDATVVAGSAEAIPLVGGSVDAVTVGQAFHWFDADAAMAEIRRVARAGGGLAVVFNERDERRPWVAALSEAIAWHRHDPSRYQRTDWGRVIGADDGARFDWEQPMTRALLAARVRSISYVALLPPADREAVVARALAVVEGLPEPFPMPYVTRLWWVRPLR